MKMLLLCHRVPFPLNDGGAIGVDYFISGYLQQGIELSVLSFNTSKHFVAEQHLPAYYKQLQFFKTVYLDNKLKVGAAVSNLLLNQSYHAQRFKSDAFQNALVELLQTHEFDVIQFDNVYLSHYVNVTRTYSKAKLCCRIHNIEHLIWRRLASNEKALLKRTYLHILTAQLQQFELAGLKQFDCLLSIAKEDETLLRSMHCKTPIYYFPFGIEMDEELMHSKQCNFSNTCYHIGSMDWLPNQQGIKWFVEEIWPLIQAKQSHMQCFLAGKNFPKQLINPTKGITIKGQVESAQFFSDQLNVLVVPLLSGDGIRVKILEAMADAKKIVTTSIGLRGIEAEHAKHLYVANNPQDFAACVVQAIADQTPSMNRSAQKFVFEFYNKATIFKNALMYFKDWVSNKN